MCADYKYYTMGNGSPLYTCHYNHRPLDTVHYVTIPMDDITSPLHVDMISTLQHLLVKFLITVVVIVYDNYYYFYLTQRSKFNHSPPPPPPPPSISNLQYSINFVMEIENRKRRLHDQYCTTLKLQTSF